MGVDRIRMNEVDFWMRLGILDYWIKEPTLWRDGFGVINSVVRIRHFLQ